jgi:hypothetical protein
VDSSVESSEVDGFTAIGIDFCCLVRGLGTGFGFSCGISDMSIALLSNVWETPATSHRLAFGINKDSKQPVGSYVKNLRDRLTHAYQLATVISFEVLEMVLDFLVELPVL